MKFRWKIAQFFEARWWHSYLHGKTKEDYLAWKKQYWRAFLEQAGLETAPSGRVLDAGCGPAGIFICLDQAARVTALDPLLPTYRQLWDSPHELLFPEVQFVATPLEDFQAAEPYDLVFCLNVINHVADLDVCLKKLKELTRPKGTLVLAVDTHNYLFFKWLFQLIPGDILHPQQLDLAGYTQRLEKQGFEIVRQKSLCRQFFFNYQLLVATACEGGGRP